MATMDRSEFDKTHSSLASARRELEDLQVTLLTVAIPNLERHKDLVAEIQELHRRLEGEVFVLDDGRKVWKHQFDAITEFAQRNHLDVSGMPRCVKIQDMNVIECNFNALCITTLHGLQSLGHLQKLDVSNNPDLRSLSGIPTESLEILDASKCGLLGDLSDLGGATKLQKIDVSSNRDLESLGGVATDSLRECLASDCSVVQGVAELREARNLSRYRFFNNPSENPFGSGKHKVLRAQLPSLEAFAAANDLPLSEVYSRIGMSRHDGSIVSADFNCLGLTTLKGLRDIWTIMELSISGNPGLVSLEGVPTQWLRILAVEDCALDGDLRALKDATVLNDLNLSNNRRLDSIRGAPLKSLKHLALRRCNLHDLSALSGLNSLSTLDVSYNPGLTSLTGVPTENLAGIDARYCNLMADLEALKDAKVLEVAFVMGNPNLTSLKGLTSRKISEIHAERCGLSHDLAAISELSGLTTIDVSHNPGLTSLHGLPTTRLQCVDAEDCNLSGDHTFLLADSKKLTFSFEGNSELFSIDHRSLRRAVFKPYWSPHDR
jgi:Leucine-rich repeat (LRR) protein